MQDHNSAMKATSYTQNQAIQIQADIVCIQNTIHKHVQNIIILITSKYIYNIKMERPFPYLSNKTAIKISTCGLSSTEATPSQISIY